MKRILMLFVVAILSLLVACGTADGAGDGNGGGGNGSGSDLPTDVPSDIRQTAVRVVQAGDDYRFSFMEAPVTEREWDIEIYYATRDVQAVYDYYHQALLDAGLARTDFESDDDEFEADYERSSDDLKIELEVEREGNRVHVDMDTDDFEGEYEGDFFSLAEFAGLDVPFYGDPDDVLHVEWEFNFDHPGQDTLTVFDFYDNQLQTAGWTQVELDDDDDDEFEAEYERDGVFLELEVDDDGEVEIEVNKLRFY